MKTTEYYSKFLKHFFVCFLLLNLTLTLGACSDETLEDNEELTLFNSDKDEEPDPDNRRFSLLASDKDEEPDPDDRD
ncbi:hypothetical protein [Aquimarina sp. RZ0]|uniref:hypothetical protein n=1 Tax=Aquimarina sp. RZ0 TaxID=2607730 RepID=UPI0011F3F407|nr:hypothetical protein [Aquimarina sp. RZ0]KAA1243346.1 hypothetical protein F0000_21600 [Aquimarina sp. RZ0]